jgi:hypothetical protein
VISSVHPEHGWWIVGRAQTSDELIVAVSHNQGRDWSVQPLGVKSAGNAPAALATYNGQTAYMFVPTAEGMAERRTVDGGRTWHAVAAQMPWPALSSGASVVSRRVGAVVRPDGSVLVWLEDPPVAVFLESGDGGRTFTSAVGPGGPIVPISDGYVSVSDPPKVSGDGRSWTSLPAPPYRLPG